MQIDSRDIELEPARPHVVCTYRDSSGLFAAYGQLRQDGVKPSCIIHDGAWLTVQYREPDGTIVELRSANASALAA